MNGIFSSGWSCCGDRGLYLEYLLRIADMAQSAPLYFSFWGLIDLATIPLYVMWLWPEISLNYVFCLAGNAGDPRAAYSQPLLRFMPSLNVFWRAIVSARHQLILFLFVYRHCDGDFRLVNVSD